MARTKIPDPSCPWISITSTYDAITTKLNDGTGSKSDQLAAIDYWMARLQEDRASVASGGHANTH